MPSGDGNSGSFVKSPAPLRLETYLPYRLNVLATRVSEALEQLHEQRFGLGTPEWRVIASLGQFGTSTAKQVGQHAHMHKTKVSRAVAELERRKLIERRTNIEDHREAFLSLTDEGRAVYDELAPLALEFARRLAEGIDDHEHSAFDRVLSHLSTKTDSLVHELRRFAE